MAEWLEGVDLLDPEAVAVAARPVMAAMDNPNGLERAAVCCIKWCSAVATVAGEHDLTEPEWDALERRVGNALDLVGLDLMDGKDWCESATGVRA